MKLNDKIRDQKPESGVPAVFTLEAVGQELVRKGYDEKQVARVLRNQRIKDRALRIAPIVAVLLFVIAFGLFLRPEITGFITGEQAAAYTQDVSFTVARDTERTWFLEHVGKLRSIALSGSVSAGGTAKIYIEHEGQAYLVFDSDRLNVSNSNLITGFAVMENETSPGPTASNVTAESDETVDKSISIDLAYDSGSAWDANNDGREPLDGVIDLTVENSGLNGNIDENNLCTRWEVKSLDTLSTQSVCNGNAQCCNFLDLEPLGTAWNESFLLTYQKYNSTANNEISAQIVYYNVNFSDLEAEIINSEKATLPARFQQAVLEFNDTCHENCLLDDFNASSYRLIFDVDNVGLTIDAISYSVLEEHLENATIANATNISVIEEKTIQYQAVIGKPVKWKKTIKLNETQSNITVQLPKEATNINVTKKVENETVEVEKARVKTPDFETSIKTFNAITGNVIAESQEANDTTEIFIEEPVEEIEIEYETEAPQAIEEEINAYSKRITVSSNVHYENILTFTELPVEAPEGAVRLYWLVNDSRTEVNASKFDTNNNSLIDYIEWITPSLSNQTYEVEITILNVQSYPMVGGNWTVAFTTFGIANLTISASNGTTYGNGTPNDLEWLGLRCGNLTLTPVFNGTHVFYENYSCNATAGHIVKVHTVGVHTQEFIFGDQMAYAHNLATNESGYKMTLNGVIIGGGDQSSEGSYKLNLIVTPTDGGFRVNESTYKMTSTVYVDDPGGKVNESSYKLSIVPEPAFISYSGGVTPSDQPANVSPSFTLAINNTAPRINDTVQLSVKVIDADLISMIIASWNGTNGSWMNVSNITVSASSVNYTVNLTVNVSNGNTTGWLFYANDSLGTTFTASALNTFKSDLTGPGFTGQSINFSAPYRGKLVKINVTALDGTALRMVVFGWNDSGIWQNISNVSVSGLITSYNYSVNLTVNASRGAVVGYQFYAKDTSDNWNYSTLATFTVSNAPPSLNGSFIGSQLPLDDSDLVGYWEFEDNAVDTVGISSAGTIDGVINGTTNATGYLARGFRFNGSKRTDGCLYDIDSNGMVQGADQSIISQCNIGNCPVWLTEGTSSCSSTLHCNGLDVSQNGGVLAFDGALVLAQVGKICSGTHVNLGNNESLYFNASGNYTLSAWIYPASLRTYAPIVSRTFRVFADEGYTFALFNSTGSYKLYFSPNNLQTTTIQSNRTVNLNEWTHVAAIYANESVTFYINGEIAGNQSSTAFKDDAYAASRVLVGMETGNANAFTFDGFIDEVAIYNRTLSANEIRERFLFNNTLSTQHLKAAANESRDADNDNLTIAYRWYRNDILNASTVHNESGLLAYYPFDSDAFDYGGNKNGTINGTTLVADGKMEKAYRFDGAHNFINLSYNAFSNNDVDKGTVALWVRLEDTNPRQVLFDDEGFIRLGYNESSSCSSSNHFSLFINDGDNVAVCSTTSALNRTWYHVAGTWDGTTIRIYIDGTEEANAAQGSPTPESASQEVWIGSNFSGAHYLNGTLDEMAVWNRSLTAAEISQLYTGGRWGGALINSTHTRGNENWTVEIQTADYQNWGTPVNSSTLIIQDNAATYLLTVNNTFPKKNEIVQLSALVNDTDGISMIIASWNGSTGIWQNVSNVTLASSGNNYSVNLTVGVSRNTIVGWLFYTNDTIPQFTSSSVETFAIQDTPPGVPNVTSPVNGSFSSQVNILYAGFDLDNDVINFTVYINDTYNISTQSNITNIDIGDGNWTLKVSAYDGSNYSANASLFFIKNAPPAIELVSPANNSLMQQNLVNFTYTLTDTFPEACTLYTNASGSWSANVSESIAATGTYNFTINISANGHHAWSVLCNDTAGTSVFGANYTLRLIAAEINITSPLNNSIFYPNNVTTFNITELTGQDFIQNMVLIINGTQYTAYNRTNEWNLTFNFSSLPPKVINVTAVAYNQSSAANVTDQIILRISKTNATQPLLNRVCSNQTYVLNNTAQTLFVQTDLDVPVDSVFLNVTAPSGTIHILNYTSVAQNNLSYTFYFSYTPQEAGNHTLTGIILDSEQQRVNKSFNLTVTTETTLFNYTINGATSASFRDICSDTILHSGIANITATVPRDSKFNLELVTDLPKITFVGVANNISANVSYANLNKAISAPSGRRAIAEFEINSTLSAYDFINISYNYSSEENALDNENDLEFYKCTSRDSCTFVLLASALDNISNVFSTNVTNLSVFLVAEPAVTTTTVTVDVTPGGGGGGGGGATRITLLELRVAGPLETIQDNVITTPIELINNGQVELQNINLEVESNSSGITAEIFPLTIDTIGPKERRNATLTITTSGETGRFKTMVTANVGLPYFTSNLDVFIDVLEKQYINRTLVVNKIQFAEDLFKQHPECVELGEVLDDAQSAIDAANYQGAFDLIEQAVQTCRDLIAAKEEFLGPKVKPNEMVLFGIEIFAIVILMLMMYSYYRRHFGT